MARIDEVLREHRKRLLAREAATIQIMTSRWMAVERRLEDMITLLALELDQLERSGQVITPGQIARWQRYQDLMAQVRAEVEQYNSSTARDIAENQRVYGQQGASYVNEALRASLTLPDTAIVIPWNQLPVDAVNSMIGYAGDGSPLMNLLMRDYEKTAAKIGQELINAVSLGWNPRKTAREIQNAMAGNFQRALVVARNEQLRAFRAATQLGFEQNADVLEGWVWDSALDGRTCPICWGLHGSVHPITEQMQDHVCGRCAMRPLTKSWEEIGRLIGADLSDVSETRTAVLSGDSVLRKRSESFQRQVFAKHPSRFELWKKGLNLRDMVGWKDDPEWGRSPVLKPLKDLEVDRG